MSHVAAFNKYAAIIGLEVHIQLNLKRKMFSPEANSYGSMPNTEVSEVTLAHPGILPSINKAAIESAIVMGLACHASITEKNYFARKNYFYPDLPKGFQITQATTPICKGGYITIDTENGSTRDIALERIHLEEDTGKSNHELVEGESLLDFNRAGTPLIELVTRPVLKTAGEAYSFLAELRKIVRYLGICSGNMEEGALRCDANVSIMPKTSDVWGIRTEVKNMNSLKNVQSAIIYEIDRQINVVESGGKIAKETRYFQADKGVTVSLRSKESAQDYRYFTEPNLSPVVVSQDWVKKIQSNLPLLPRDWYNKLVNEFQLPPYDASVLTGSKSLLLFFEEIAQYTKKYKAISNWIMGPIKSYLNELKVGVSDFPLSAKTITSLIELVESNQVSFSSASQKIYPYLLQHPKENPIEVAKKLQLLQEQDEDAIVTWIEEVIQAYPEKVTAYQQGKKGLLGFFMGEVMKKSKGKVNPQKASLLIKTRIDNE